MHEAAVWSRIIIEDIILILKSIFWPTLAFFFWLQSMWDFGSLTRDQTCSPCTGSVES